MDESGSHTNSRTALEQFQQNGHRSAVAILLYEPGIAIDWHEVALVNSLGLCDYVVHILTEVNADSRFLNLDADTERARLSRLAETPDAHSCVLVTEFDIALARLDDNERARLWYNLLHHFPHRRTALLLAVPSGASHLLPDSSDALTHWTDTGKVIPLTYP